MKKLAIMRAAFAFFLWVAAGCISAQDYPSKPVRVIMPFAPGGITDILARAVGKELGDSFGQPFVVDNRPGANGTIGTDAVVKATPDGYTILFSPASTHTLTPLLNKLSYDPMVDLAPVGIVATTALVLVVNPQVPANSVSELVAWIKTKAGQVNYGSYGSASASHLAGELFKQLTKVDMTHVAYKGGAPAQMDLIGGHISLMFSDMSAMQHVRSGKLRALAVTSLQPSSALPDLPTVAGPIAPGFEAGGWFALYAPRGTPKPIIDRLSSELERIVASDVMKQRIAALGVEAAPGGPARLSALMRVERDKWRKVISDANIKAE